MRIVTQKEKLVTRTLVANPNADIGFFAKLKQVGAVNATRNHKVVVAKSGYIDIVPIDNSRTY